VLQRKNFMFALNDDISRKIDGKRNVGAAQ